MLFLQTSDNLFMFFLGLLHLLVPVAVELLVLHDVCLLNLLALLCLVHTQLLTTTTEVLIFQLCDSVLCHLSLYEFMSICKGKMSSYP